MIGIIGRINDNRITFNKEIIDIINEYDNTPLGIIVDFNNNYEKEFNKIKPLIDMCDKIILQGGNECYKIDLLIAKYLYDKNIPTLGICLGMQTMALAFNGIEEKINNHQSKNKYVHNVIIDKKSKLYEIIKNDNILVNSRHNYCIKQTNLDICGKNDVIEAIEDKNKKFYIGLQWHPESLDDEVSNNIFDYFFSLK